MVDKKLIEPAKVVIASVNEAVVETTALLSQSGPLPNCVAPIRRT